MYRCVIIMNIIYTVINLTRFIIHIMMTIFIIIDIPEVPSTPHNDDKVTHSELGIKYSLLKIWKPLFGFQTSPLYLT